MRRKYPINLNPKIGHGVEAASDHQIVFVITDCETIDGMEVPNIKGGMNIFFLKRQLDKIDLLKSDFMSKLQTIDDMTIP